MAYRIECDRCGESERVKSTSDLPIRWLQFNDLHRGNGDATAKPIAGGVFCAFCANALERWRTEAPAMPAKGAA